MKLFRYNADGKVKQGVIINEKHYDVSGFGEDYNELFFESDGLNRLQEFLDEQKEGVQEIQGNVQLAPPIARPSKIVCVGLNYANHAKETGAAFPSEPVLFMKATSSIIGPNDNIVIPKGSVKTDWEVELAIVIGKKASYVSEGDALQYVAGYCLHNDVSEREFQLERNGTWDKGKGCDTFAPIGPFLATQDEVENIDNLRLWLKLNEKIMQDGNTSDFIFKVPYLVSYISQFMSLLPGDVISTGTPAGVGLGMNPQVYLKPGDVVELGIDGLGSSKQKVVAYEN